MRISDWSSDVCSSDLFVIARMGVISLSVLRRSARETERANALLGRANEELEDRIAERTADLQEANDEIQRFAYIVSHDLRSPLVNIMGFTSEQIGRASCRERVCQYV